MAKKRILFVCIHNSGRSQMAEAFVRALGGDRFEAHSAGLEPGKLNPFVVAAMKEIGIDISGARTKSVFEMRERGLAFDFVVTVCDEGNSERCPVFPGGTRLHWGFKDPAGFAGTDAERLARTREVRDEIKAKVEEFLSQGGLK